MNTCEDIQNEFDAFLCDDIDELTKMEIREHLEDCPSCTRALQQHKRLSEVLQTWEEIEPSPNMYEQLVSRIRTPGLNWKAIFSNTFSRKTALRLAQVAVIVIITLLINSWLQKPLSVRREDQATIKFFLQEHQGAVVQSISAELLSRPATHMYIGRDDILYFEYVEDHPKITQPGMILRGPKVKQQIALIKAPAIIKGRIIEKPQIHLSVNFDPLIPERLPNGYVLTSIRAIKNYNSLHLLYTKELDTVSLFQQSSHTQEGLSAQDFRDYAVYCSQEPDTDVKIKGMGTILAWSNSTIAFVLIGDADLSELMKMVPSINQYNK
jgi:hypothetical protein